MNWDAIGAVGEILGSIAVFVALAYAAIQVRDAKRGLRASLSAARGDVVRSLMEQAREPRLHALDMQVRSAEGNPPNPFIRYAKERWQLSDSDAVLLWSIQFSWWQYRIQVISHVDDLPEIERYEFERAIRQLLTMHGPHRAFYELIAKSTLHPKALAYFESVLARPA
jgi:hypothetical protein